MSDPASSSDVPREGAPVPTLDVVEMTGEGKTCSFCGVGWTPENRFHGGLGAFICRDCADRACSRMNDDTVYAEYLRNPTPPWDSMSDEELLARLPEIMTNAEQVERFLHEWVGLLRGRGVSWQRIGLALGVTRQAAWERFTRVKRSVTKASEQA